MRSVFPTRRLSSTTFREVATASLFMLVRVESDRPVLHRGVGEFFSRQYPQLFSFGTLPIRETRGPGWWDRHFQTAVGPAKGSRTGYWLFQEADIVGHHSGVVRTDVTFKDRTATDEDYERGHAEVAWIQQVAFDGARVSSLELAAAVELITFFDGIVCARQARAGFGEGTARSRDSRFTAAPVSPQQVAIPGASGDPFEILKILSDATDDEVRVAYKRQMKLNHPDKVSHMSDEIQAYAHAQVRVIKAAYLAIRSVRGRGSC